MQSKAVTVEDYLKSLPDDRRAAIEAVRKVFLDNIDENVEERMSYGMIGYAIPHRVFPAGYHCDPKMPLPYAGLASQKGHMSLYLMTVYDCEGENTLSSWFRAAWAKTGKKLDMGKCCVRFKKLEDVAIEVVAEAIRRMPSATHIKHYETMLASMGKPVKTPKSEGKAAPTERKIVKKAAPKKAVAKPAARPAKKAAKKTAKKSR